MSRGLRNNNPGNIRLSSIRYKGEVESRDKEFKSFSAMEWGYRAIFVLLYTYQTRHGLNTIEQMINRYAPPSENATAAYIRFVAKQANIQPDEVVDSLCPKTMIPIVSAMSYIENGAVASRLEVNEGWRLFLEQRP